MQGTRGDGASGRGISALLFPDVPRAFPLRREVKILLRSVHVLLAGVLTGCHVLGADPARAMPWLLGTIGSGILILLLDLHESAAFLLQVRGLVVAGKIALVAVLPWCGDAQGGILAFLVVVSVLSSHAPSSVRYHLVFGGGRVRGPQSKG